MAEAEAGTPAHESRTLALRILGGVLMLAGFISANARVVNTWISLNTLENGGVDYPVLHAMGQGIAHGINVYELNDPNAVGQGVVGMVYPPATGFAALPFALLPFPIARAVFFLVTNLVVVLGCRALVRHVAPKSATHVWLIATGLVLMAASIRWGMMLLQLAPLMFGLLCFFIVALDSGKTRLAIAIAALATALKMTLALPFLGLLALHRRFVGFGIAVGTWVTLNGLGFLRMGPEAFATYRANVAKFEVVDASWNINGPDPWLPVSLPRLDWVFLLYGILRDLPLSRLLNLVLAGVTALWLLKEAWRKSSHVPLATSYLFLTPLVCLGSLAVYHHQYDACLFLVPILLAFFLSPELRKPGWGALLTLPILFIVLLLPIGMAQNLLKQFLGDVGPGLVKISFPFAISLALIGSLALLRRHLSAGGHAR